MNQINKIEVKKLNRNWRWPSQLSSAVWLITQPKNHPIIATNWFSSSSLVINNKTKCDVMFEAVKLSARSFMRIFGEISPLNDSCRDSSKDS